VKAIRDYSDGQWVLFQWALIALVLVTGLLVGSTAMVVLALLAAVGGGYTTYLYIRQLQSGPRSASPASDADRHQGGPS
jgi:hypothetical protein